MKKILIIEDDVEVRESIIEIIENGGFSVMQAEDGANALEILENEIPDLIISDVMMPKIDGMELLKKIRSNPKTSMLPFIFLTAKADYLDLRNGMNYGADDYIFKPFKAKELLSSVQLRLDRNSKYNDKLSEIALNLTKYIPHELRTPLFPIIGFSGFLVSDYQNLKPAELIDIFSKINKSGTRLHKTIEKFLLYTEMELLKFDKPTLEILRKKSTTNVKPLIENLIKNKVDEYKRVDDLKIEITDSDLKINEDHFQFIIGEAIENALKFSQNGSEIEIKSFVNEDYYKIIIKDNGIGMSFEQLKNFGPFIQHNRSIHNQDGNGLGIAIITSMLNLYDGYMQIESEPDRSTKIEINLQIKNMDEK